MRIFYRLLADTIWIIHFCVVMIALFGWLVPQIFYLYLLILLCVLLSNIFLHYCILSKWEYELRRKINPDLEYEFSYSSYYTYRITNGYLSKDFLRYTGLWFPALSLVINLYFAYFF
jgi:Protein of Unknown function (DUF2784)